MYNDTVFSHHLAHIASAFMPVDRRYLLISPPRISNRYYSTDPRKTMRLRAVATSYWTEWHHLLRSKLGNQARWKEDQASITDNDPALGTSTLR